MPSPREPGLAHPSVRLFHTLRTAHLERAHALAPASILYRVRRYDFDDELARGLDLARVTPAGIARRILRAPITTLEINEPLMLASLPESGAALGALAVRRILGRPTPTLVAYAIANADPFEQNSRSETGAVAWRTRLRRLVERRLARAVWARLDRVVYGTDDARELYRALLGAPKRADETTIVALSAPDPHAGTHPVTPGSVVFVGALMPRKGIRVLLDAWPRVVAERPDATLAVLGKGPLEAEVVAAVADDPSVRVEIDPLRARIHEVLDSSQVLTLPSQPSPTWREQIGLPIVEGLSHGCTIVATRETSLAGWLAEHGHVISDDAESADALARALVAVLDASRGGRPSRADVLASLPQRDGRLLADDWLFERASAASPEEARHAV